MSREGRDVSGVYKMMSDMEKVGQLHWEGKPAVKEIHPKRGIGRSHGGKSQTERTRRELAAPATRHVEEGRDRQGL